MVCFGNFGCLQLSYILDFNFLSDHLTLYITCFLNVYFSCDWQEGELNAKAKFPSSFGLVSSFLH